MAERITSSHRLRRILAIVPWVAERDGPTIEEICERFGIARDALLADLNVVFMVGIPPYTPDTLIDVVIEDDRVWIQLGDYFRRPLRLSPAEGLALLAAGEATAVGLGDDDPLARGLRKLASVLGVRLGGDGELDVSLGDAPTDLLHRLRDAVSNRRLVELDYYSFARDEHAVRLVEPTRVTAQDGAWYLVAWCHLAQDERVFRLDRIASAKVTEATFEPRGEASGEVGYRAAPGDLRVRLRLAPGARWVAEHHPVLDSQSEADGSLVVTMAVAALPWLLRLLLRLGPDATLIDVLDGSGTSVESILSQQRSAAREILARYQS